jgi:putative membrane protein
MSQSTTEDSPSWFRILIVVVAALLLLPLLMMTFMMPMMGMMGWWGGGLGTGVGMSPLLGIGMMLVGLLVLLGIAYALYRAFARNSLDGGDTAIEELRLAYARGEISQEEFEQRREDLERTE